MELNAAGEAELRAGVDHTLHRVQDEGRQRGLVQAAGVVDFAHGQLESSEQVPACPDPARPGERNESADLHG
jgi:hypothetical protein